VRKYEQYRDDARGMTAGLCILLAVSVVGTIVFSAIAMAGVTVAAAYGYLTNMTEMELPAGYWEGVFQQRLIQSAVVTVLAVLGTAIYRTWQLSDGGGRWVARAMGGTRVLQTGETDASRVKLMNVVEELAVATGLRTPSVYVLENEPGINAFAAGLDDKDAVVGVTRGAIEKLKRHQLQGVVAHEFSHIAHGDMRLNVRLMGILAGIQAIATAANFLLRLAMPNPDANGRVSKHPLGMVLAFLFGAALWPIGRIGSLFAMLIHLAVNRQREFLADASAVQYTRDPIGLCEALQVLLEEEEGSRVRGPGLQFASHMFFASGRGTWERLFATHPPLQERIRRLEPAVATAGCP